MQSSAADDKALWDLAGVIISSPLLNCRPLLNAESWAAEGSPRIWTSPFG